MRGFALASSRASSSSAIKNLSQFQEPFDQLQSKVENHSKLPIAYPNRTTIIEASSRGKAYDEEEPETGGTGVVGYDPYTGSGILGNVPHTGGGVAGDDHDHYDDHDHDHYDHNHDPAQIVDKALLCFNDKHIYSSCEEAYRLSESGNLNVPPEYADEYCNGPCLAETHLVLNCLENIMEHFVFFNKATIRVIRDTLKAGCGHGPERGDFNVAEHLEVEENSAYKKEIQIPFGIGLAMIGNALLL